MTARRLLLGTISVLFIAKDSEANGYVTFTGIIVDEVWGTPILSRSFFLVREKTRPFEVQRRATSHMPFSLSSNKSCVSDINDLGIAHST